jgi:hypothetical protein
VTDDDRDSVPEGLKGSLSGTDQSGNVTTINYDGDVLLEYKFPYEIKITSDTEFRTPRPTRMTPPKSVQETSIRLRFSLMLAVERTSRAQLVPTWLTFSEPLEYGQSMEWNDPREGAIIAPTQLTDAEVVTWREWYDKLSESPVSNIELALTRILRAVAERRESSDVLVDAVIAWENLFGTKDGEPTFRVTACIAKLLAPSIKDRLPLKSRLGKIYALRSKVVHGSGSISSDDQPLCQEALDTAIMAVKHLIGERMDILALADGAQRSAALLLGD